MSTEALSLVLEWALDFKPMALADAPHNTDPWLKRVHRQISVAVRLLLVARIGEPLERRFWRLNLQKCVSSAKGFLLGARDPFRIKQADEEVTPFPLPWYTTTHIFGAKTENPNLQATPP